MAIHREKIIFELIDAEFFEVFKVLAKVSCAGAVFLFHEIGDSRIWKCPSDYLSKIIFSLSFFIL